jgi:hypothetical protein
MTILLVFGGGALPVADLEGGPVHGPGAAALDAAQSLASGADLDPAGAALDVALAPALAAPAERAQVQRSGPQGEGGDDGQDEAGAHAGSPVPLALAALAASQVAGAARRPLKYQFGNGG